MTPLRSGRPEATGDNVTTPVLMTWSHAPGLTAVATRCNVALSQFAVSATVVSGYRSA